MFSPQILFLIFYACISQSTAYGRVSIVKDLRFSKSVLIQNISILASMVKSCVEEDYPGNVPTCIRWEFLCEYQMRMPNSSIVGWQEVYILDHSSPAPNPVGATPFPFLGLSDQPTLGNCQNTANIWKQKYALRTLKYSTREVIQSDFSKDFHTAQSNQCFQYFYFLGTAVFTSNFQFSMTPPKLRGFIVSRTPVDVRFCRH